MREAPRNRSLPAPPGVVVEREPDPVRSPFRDGAQTGTIRVEWRAAPRRFAVLFALVAVLCGSLGAYGLSPELEVGDSVPGVVTVGILLTGCVYCVWAAVALWRNRVRADIREGVCRAAVGPVRVPGLFGVSPTMEIALDEVARVTVLARGDVYVVVLHTTRGQQLSLPFGGFEQPIATFVAHTMEAARGSG